ncbi:unnamed protein product [Rotaria sordida]|uniref:3-hydroxyanthranilate 3,4-dioxygenase n=1 Tax=Rotaria sordida TaxID=392033 RepID=A0A814E2E1_9BILA|nr:unnamed protein product [Rotaria sordida]CAF3629631.1 unnamed protein product [Rotaria sordida]
MPSSPINKINVDQWLKENEQQFQPPVCNKLLHNNQLTIMFVGGPNIRKDYHLEEGEEVFYQIKGDMCLKVLEQNQHRDIMIKEGEIFLLPANIPHSPNRFENSMGFVMERKRDEDELDCVRYYQDHSTNRLYERWFHTTNLGIQLGPVIKEFFQSEEYLTGQPKADSYLENPPVQNNEKIKLDYPFSLNEWIDKHEEEFSNGKPISLFPDKFQARIYVMPKGQHLIDCSNCDVWLWQYKGHSTAKITTNDKEESVIDLEKMDSVYLNLHWT